VHYEARINVVKSIPKLQKSMILYLSYQTNFSKNKFRWQANTK